jgi:hypothetical protein
LGDYIGVPKETTVPFENRAIGPTRSTLDAMGCRFPNPEPGILM